MQISLEKFSVFLTGIASVGLVLATGYFLYTIFFEGPQPDPSPVLTVASVGVFGPKLQRATAAIVDPGSKIELNKQKNLLFVDSALYASFTEDPEDIMPSKVRGRENPFLPSYATP